MAANIGRQPHDQIRIIEMGDHHRRGADGDLRHTLPDDACSDCGALLVARPAANGYSRRQTHGLRGIDRESADHGARRPDRR